MGELNYGCESPGWKGWAMILAQPLGWGTVFGEWELGVGIGEGTQCGYLSKLSCSFEDLYQNIWLASPILHTVDLFLLVQNFPLPCFAQLYFLLHFLLPFRSLFGLFLCTFYLGLNVGLQGPICSLYVFLFCEACLCDSRQIILRLPLCPLYVHASSMVLVVV